MPIRGDRLRWPPRPGKKFSESAGTRRSLATDEKNTNDPLRRPDEREETADHPTRPQHVIERAHDHVQAGQQDTDLRNRSGEVIDAARKPGTLTLRRK